MGAAPSCCYSDRADGEQSQVESGGFSCDPQEERPQGCAGAEHLLPLFRPDGLGLLWGEFWADLVMWTCREGWKRSSSVFGSGPEQWVWMA